MNRKMFRYWPMLAALLIATAGNADPLPALRTVQRFQATLLDVMKQGSALTYPGRRDWLATAVNENFDVEFVTRTVIDSHWNTLAPSQRNRFQSQLMRMAVATLAARFSRYRGEEFLILSSKTLNSGKEVVYCKYRYPEGDEIKVDYLLRQSLRGWGIVNIWFDGVSVTNIQRKEFSRVIESEGFEALVEKFERRIRYFEGGGT